MKKANITRNWLILIAAAVIVALVAANSAAIFNKGATFLPAALTREKEWDPIAAGDRIEEASGFDVLRIGPQGGFPKRAEMSSLVIKIAELFFEEAEITEETRLTEDLGANDETKVQFVLIVKEVVDKTTKYRGYVSKSFPSEMVTIGDMVDYIADHFSASAGGLLGATPRFHVAVVSRPPDLSGSLLAVTIVGYKSDGAPIYKFLEPGDYTWDPKNPLEEDLHMRWSFWTAQKWEWFKDQGGLFPPGKYRTASLAVRQLYQYITIKEYKAPLINAVLQEAYYYEEVTGERFWRMIELDFIWLAPWKMAPAVDENARAAYVVYRDALLMGTQYIARGWSSFNRVDERHTYKITRYYLDRAFKYEKRELAVDEVQDLLGDPYKSVYVPGATQYGPAPYLYGFNHSWRGDDAPACACDQIAKDLRRANRRK